MLDEINIQKCSYSTDKLESDINNFNIKSCNINSFNTRISVLYDILINKCKLDENWKFKIELISYKSIDDIKFLNNLNLLQSYLETKYKNIKNVDGNINESENFKLASLNFENEEILKYITYYLVEFVCEIERKLKIKNYKQKIVKLLLIIPNVNYYITNYVSDVVAELQQNTAQITLYHNIYITLSLIVENGIRTLKLNKLCNKIINTYINNQKIELNNVEFLSPDVVLDFLVCTGTNSNDKVNGGIVSKVDEIVLKCMNVILANHLYSPGNVSSIYTLLRYFYNIISNNVLTNEHTTVVTCNFIYALELLYDHFDARVYTALLRISRNNSYKLVEKSILIFLSHSTKEFEDGENLISHEFSLEWNEILNNCYKIIINELNNHNNKYISNYILVQLIHLYLININKLAVTYFVNTIDEEAQYKAGLREKLVNLFKLISSNDIDDKKLLKYLISTIKRIDGKFVPGTICEVKESVNLEKLYGYYSKLENGSVIYTIMVHNGLKYIMYSTSGCVTNKVSLEQLLCEGVPLVSESEVDDRMITSDKLTMMEKLIVNTNEQLVNLIPNYIKILIYVNQMKMSEKKIDKGIVEHEVNGNHYKEYNGLDKQVDVNREVLSKYNLRKILEEVENAEIIELKDLNFLLTILINNLKNITISTKTERQCKLRTKLFSAPELNKYILVSGTETTDEIEVIVDDKYKLDKKTLYHNLYYNNINIVMNIIRFISIKKKLNQLFVLKFLLTRVLYNVNMCNQNYFIFLINNIINNIIIRIAACGGVVKNDKINENEDEEELVIGEILVLLYNNLNNDVAVNILNNFIVKLHENIEGGRLIGIKPLFSCLLKKLYSLFKEVKVDDKLLLFNTTLEVQKLIERIYNEKLNRSEGEEDHHSDVLLSYIKENESLLQSVNTSKYEVNVYYILLYLKCASNYNKDMRNRRINNILNNYINRTLNMGVDTKINETRTKHILETILNIIKQYHENLNQYINNNVNILPILNLLNHYIEIDYNCIDNEVMVQIYKYLVSIMNKVVNKYISYNNNMVFLDCRGYYIENSGERIGSGDKDGVDDEPKMKNYLIYKLMFEVISLIRIMVEKLEMDLHRFNILVINYIINIRNISIIDKFNNLLSITLRKYVNTSTGVLDYNSVVKVKNHVKDEVESEDTRKECGRLDEANKLFKDFINDVKSGRNGADRFVKSKITVNCTEENNKLMFYIHYMVNILLHNDYTNIKVNETISGGEKLNFVGDFEEFEVKVGEMDINIRCEYISMIFMTIIKTINNKNAGNKVLMINNIISLLLEIIDGVNVNVVINILRYIYRCVHSKYINSTTLNNTINNIKSIYDNTDGKFTINWKLNNSILLLLSTIISCHTLNNTTENKNSIGDENIPKLDNQVNENPNTIDFNNGNRDSILRLIKRYKTKYVSLFIYYFHQINSVMENSKDGDGYPGLCAHEKPVVDSLIKYCINNKLLSNNKLYVLLFKYCYKTRHRFLNYLLNDVKENYNEITFYVKFHVIQILFDSPKCYYECGMTEHNLLTINIILLKLLNDWDIKIRNEVKEKIKKGYIKGDEDNVMNEEVYSYEYIILSNLYQHSKDLFYSISYYFINFYNDATKTGLSTSNGSVSDDFSVIYEVEDEDDGGVNIIKNILLIIRNKEKDQRLISDLINKLYGDTSCNSLKNCDEDSFDNLGKEDFIKEFRVDNIILYALRNIKDDITRDIIVNL
ncbi:uncharacterized protein TA21160 [Theileria annulata]|uniref:Uncharacterized protein n=1 Tax=Theileria annulata TaxID=5874 RepID=Q4UGS4_THEAN|nr:uncharacterized protein TA21160 [Theileria annulata]CAI73715.1 hypothetical protein TA21160 [Theileria annulata]|eukprot:XP_954392.1 hypothetical protein TA21160 [Theileria annulata]